MRHLLDDSIVLADDSSVCRTLAEAAAVAVPTADAGMDDDVAGRGCDHRTLAEHVAVPR